MAYQKYNVVLIPSEAVGIQAIRPGHRHRVNSAEKNLLKFLTPLLHLVRISPARIIFFVQTRRTPCVTLSSNGT
jgi:hypothetical protein